MKIHLFQELLALNEEFGHVMHGLERMEQEPAHKREMIRGAEALVGSAHADANRQFFEQFDAIVKNDALEAYKLMRDTERVTTPLMFICRSNSARQRAKRRDFRNGSDLSRLAFR